MILLVIDMQPNFRSANRRWLIGMVAREIRAARSAGWGVMFLEYTSGYGSDGTIRGVLLKERTHRCLTDLLRGYDAAITVHKGQDDGSAEVLRAAEMWFCEGGRYINGGIRVVGVNTEACVASTVNGLSAAMPDLEITVVGGACNSDCKAGNAPNNEGHDQIVTKGRNVRVLAAVVA
jgi:hypothetical protein